MKLRFYYLITFFTAAFSIQAERLKGIIVLNNNDTIHAEIDANVTFLSKFIDLEAMQYSIHYFNSSNIEKKISPLEAKEVMFKFKEENIRMISVNNISHIDSSYILPSPQLKKIFLKILVDGKLKLMDFLNTQSLGASYNSNTKSLSNSSINRDSYVIQKENGDIAKLKNFGFKNQMISYVSDCPYLVQKLNDKILKRENIEFIILHYNTNCLK
jgi:hypothetical protein